jgi:hypothetical protein
VTDGRSTPAATPLPKKLGIKEGSRIALIGAPERFDRMLGPLPNGTTGGVFAG